MQQFCDMAVEQRRLLLGLLKVVLTHASAWVTESSLRTDREFKNLLEQQAVPRESWDDKICQVGALLRGTRLGNFFLSTNASGPRSFYYIRRNLLAAEHYYMDYINVLQALDLAVGSLKGHSLDRLRQQKPKTAPEPQFLVYTSREEAAPARCHQKHSSGRCRSVMAVELFATFWQVQVVRSGAPKKTASVARGLLP